MDKNDRTQGQALQIHAVQRQHTVKHTLPPHETNELEEDLTDGEVAVARHPAVVELPCDGLPVIEKRRNLRPVFNKIREKVVICGNGRSEKKSFGPWNSQFSRLRKQCFSSDACDDATADKIKP